MEGFVPTGGFYKPVMGTFLDRPIRIVRVDDVEPLERKLSHGVFNDNPTHGSARQRVVAILQGFRKGSLIPPIELVEQPIGKPFRYRLFHGAHRFYCSLAAGFTAVPAVVCTESEVSL